MWHRIRYGHWAKWKTITIWGGRNGVWTELECSVCKRRRTMDWGGDGVY